MTDEEKEALDKLSSKKNETTWDDTIRQIKKEIRDVVVTITSILNIIEKLSKEIEELKRENLEIRDWKYVIDNPIDLDKLKELDLIKIKGKEYISKNMYDELEKDKKALVNNYSNVLGKFISKDKIKPIQIIDLDGKIHNVYKIEEE